MRNLLLIYTTLGWTSSEVVVLVIGSWVKLHGKREDVSLFSPDPMSTNDRMENGNALFMRNGQDGDDCSDQDDIWDDTALIKAYDAAVNAVKDKIAHRLGFNENDNGPKSTFKKTMKKNNNNFKNKKLEWHVGAACRATYSEDGKIYEATIKSIKGDTNLCIVKYVGYGNEEEIPIPQLMPSEGAEARSMQEEEALCDVSEIEADSHFHVNQDVHQSKRSAERERMYKREPGARGREHLTNFGSQFPPRHPMFFGHPFASSQMNSPYIFPSSIPPPPPLTVTSGLPVGDTEALSAMLMSWYMSGFHTGYYQGLQQAKRVRDVSKQSP